MNEIKAGDIFTSNAFGSVKVVKIEEDTVHFKGVNAWSVAAPVRISIRRFKADFQPGA